MDGIIEAKIKAEMLNEVMKIIGAIVEEVKIGISPEGIVIRAVDPAHVAMVDINLTSKAFNEFNATSGNIGISVSKIQEILKLADSNSVIGIKHNESKNRLIISVGNIQRNMGLLDITSMNDPKIPKVNLPAKIEIKTEELMQGIRASESITDHITLIANPEYFELLADGEMDSVSLKLTKDMIGSGNLNVKEEVRSDFSLDYLASFLKATSTGSLSIGLGINHPIQINFDIDKEETQKDELGKSPKIETVGRVLYLLAPRIEND